jgi:PII-like signaling protein
MKITGEQFLMRIFIGEGDAHGHTPLYKAIVELFRREGLAGATVIKGIAGYGAHSVYHTDQILRLSSDLPLVIETVDTEEKINALLPLLDEMVEEGMITLEKIKVIKYTHRQAGEKESS